MSKSPLVFRDQPWKMVETLASGVWFLVLQKDFLVFVSHTSAIKRSNQVKE